MLLKESFLDWTLNGAPQPLSASMETQLISQHKTLSGTSCFYVNPCPSHSTAHRFSIRMYQIVCGHVRIQYQTLLQTLHMSILYNALLLQQCVYMSQKLRSLTKIKHRRHKNICATHLMVAAEVHPGERASLCIILGRTRYPWGLSAC